VTRIDSKFNLRGRDGETISITINGEASLPGCQYVVGTRSVEGSFVLDRDVPAVFLNVNIDFNQADGDRFDVIVTGDAPESFVSKTTVSRSGAFRAIAYRFETE